MRGATSFADGQRRRHSNAMTPLIAFRISDFEFVSDFEFRISDFSRETPLARFVPSAMGLAPQKSGVAMGAKAIWRRLAGRLKALCRFGARPILPILPASVANALPGLGRVHVRIPGCPRRMSLNTYGGAGKDRIALKLGRQGVFGYEPECMQVFLRLLANTRFFVDVGANTGLYALVAAIQDPARRVVAFEPVPEIHDMLRANIALNRLANLTAGALA